MVGGRPITIEAELPADGRSRTMVNRQAVRRRSDLHEALRTTVFSPEDIALVQGGPADRRRFLDETLGVVDPKSARAGEDVDHILRQRSALLRRRAAGRRARSPPRSTSGTDDSTMPAPRWSRHAKQLVEQLAPLADGALRATGRPADRRRHWSYQRSWTGRLADALAEHAARGPRRGVTSVGPHRDELELSIGGRPARTHASQGEQRSLALALRLAAHQLATERLGEAPVLLLDDVFSELDARRSGPCWTACPPGQALLTTAVAGPAEVAGRPGRRGDAGGPASSAGERTREGRPPAGRDAGPRPGSGPRSRRWPAASGAGLGRVSGGCSPAGRTSSGRPWPRTSSPCAWTADVLVVRVDHPAWATQVRHLGDSICSTVWPRWPGSSRPTVSRCGVRG